jgi:adenylosuccinate lyase
MRAGLGELDLEKAAEYERRFRHDVMAHVHLFGDVAPAARGIIHLGATSAFISDNTDLILHREALSLVRARLVRTVAALADFARTHRDLPTLGYTHFQPAQPTTVGKRATLWIQDLLLDLEELEFRLSSLRFRGCPGNHRDPGLVPRALQGDHGKVEELDRLVGDRMGFPQSYGVSGQTYPRKVDMGVLATLAGIGASLSKFGNDLRLLATFGRWRSPSRRSRSGPPRCRTSGTRCGRSESAPSPGT